MTGRHREGGGWVGWFVAFVVIAVLGTGGWLFRESSSDPSPAPSVASPEPSSPAPSPSPLPSPSPVRERLVIHGTGDVNLDPSYIYTFNSKGYTYAWTGLKGLFKRDDLTIVNMECAVSDLGSKIPKEFNFRCDKKAMPIAKRYGVEVANLANNHGGDYGKEALLDSRRNLKKAGIEPVGAGKDHKQATKPALFDIKGWKIAVLGFGGVVPEPGWIAGRNHPGMADGDDIKKMVKAIKRADEVADLVFVTIHWGIELDLRPRPDDIERAKAMMAAGADAIFGHHTHRLQPMGTIQERPVFWGLGNFVWPSFSGAGATTAVAKVVVEPDGTVKGKLLPAFIEAPGHPVLRA